jgi:thiol:disulfide interchange protein DsbD
MAGHGNETSNHLTFRPVKGRTGLDAALDEARRADKPVLVDFYADWCVECKQIERRTLSDVAVRRALQDWVLLRADVTENDDVDKDLLQSLHLFGPPALLFFQGSTDERRDLRIVGFADSDRLLTSARRVRSPL